MSGALAVVAVGLVVLAVLGRRAVVEVLGRPVALTLVAAGLTVWSGVDTLDAKDTYNRDPSQANVDAGQAKQLRTNIAIAATAEIAAIGETAAVAIAIAVNPRRRRRRGIGRHTPARGAR